MTSDNGRTEPCPACIDWRVAQSAEVGQNIASVVRGVLDELGIDATDAVVVEVVARHLRAADPTRDDA